ncbi:MAG TPA: DUF167 domain-containing protein [Ktedonobacterales bacterium]|nr:DUF167 domain-containing protein [Ktedonobacterales bacterium]
MSERSGAVVLTIRVTPRAGRDELAFDGATLRARLAAPPVDGAANAALVELLAARLGVPRRAISILRGATSRTKFVEIAGLDPAAVRERLGISDGRAS